MILRDQMTNMRRNTISTIALAIWVAYRCQFAHGEVLFTMETGIANGAPGFETRSFANNVSRPVQLNVYAESTETKDTRWLEWTVIVPEGFALSAVPQPNPYIGGSNDFFYPHPMSIYNYTQITNSVRVVAYGSSGPRNKKGLVGVYRFNISTNTVLGAKTFQVVDTMAFSTNLDLQPSSGSQITAEIIPNYDLLMNGAKMVWDMTKLPDHDRQVPHLFVDTLVNSTFVLEASTNLTNWNPLKTNNSVGPFPFRDDGATNYARRFYRAKSL